jgi:hypothetical protein
MRARQKLGGCVGSADQASGLGEFGKVLGI